MFKFKDNNGIQSVYLFNNGDLICDRCNVNILLKVFIYYTSQIFYSTYSKSLFIWCLLVFEKWFCLGHIINMTHSEKKNINSKCLFIEIKFQQE